MQPTGSNFVPWLFSRAVLHLVFLMAAAQAAETAYYSEPFRPQFHFTPEKNWMNDPNGLVYRRG